MKTKRAVLALLSASHLGTLALADMPRQPVIQTLEVGKPLARASLLTPSTRVYLRYKIVGEQRVTIDLWRRSLSFEEHEGRRAMHISWRWDSVADQKFSRVADYWYEPETMRPLTVERRLVRNGATTVSAFRYLPDRVIGMAEVPDNSVKEFVQATPDPMYNWETDMELLQALPLKSGYEVRIPFYEAGPGRDAPGYYTYEVVGDGKIAAPDGHSVDCWIVVFKPTDPKLGDTRFFFAKKTQVMIREETRLEDGSIFVKMLLPPDVDPALGS